MIDWLNDTKINGDDTDDLFLYELLKWYTDKVRPSMTIQKSEQRDL